MIHSLQSPQSSDVKLLCCRPCKAFQYSSQAGLWLVTGASAWLHLKMHKSGRWQQMSWEKTSRSHEDSNSSICVKSTTMHGMLGYQQVSQSFWHWKSRQVVCHLLCYLLVGPFKESTNDLLGHVMGLKFLADRLSSQRRGFMLLEPVTYCWPFVSEAILQTHSSVDLLYLRTYCNCSQCSAKRGTLPNRWSPYFTRSYCQFE